ncbi:MULTISPECIES: pantoate--beta-alanine ligase [Acinetobacter]|uniref:Pantothenate synthetase n=2 Tax=Acinetobacter baylyi TaxID=202950 RepID=PANC_ACIAD|nr:MULTISPECIES: pantoate--beta-alanine ligase [Acinetobacter]Q6F855.1 RecName: Full=Pantothenate synthetase; Short=PS; AltName: Full=Pantoate--beta-alanine ligase; AltName: Full=Pantoate-activating enzyme [Acinetobacter baylyi ADP1]ENV54909.1 pantothenate synthetase [Acinetobacter baylyi DSM 14961 = CIP 107474]KAF2370210.1 pantoate--beta-alanine ligase [Acinetobacter baylyi]KAF2371325.1 pantoate--beta-alanine ligase [Acinetobacter baylyi]KAF2378136.1 pantoate--beta-alanine ligase [Acinetobact
MKTETTIQGLTASLNPARTTRKIIGFVPTMGNLHQGHLNLVREAKKLCDIVVVSIFVNPIQFGEGEDFENYPRTLEQDSHLLADVGCDIIFAPSVEQMYGKHPRLTNISVADITDDLCGQSRPGHFDGVAVVVTKLFNIVQPNVAFFGQKDYQQLAVIRQLVQDLNLPIDIIGVPIARDHDGLALSSRNGYLSEAERQIAPTIYQSLKLAEQQLHQGVELVDVLDELKFRLTAAGFVVDYVEARQPNLQPIAQFDRDLVLFVAAKLGKTRLIDNLQVKLKA